MINGLNSYSNTNFIKTYASRMNPSVNNIQESSPHLQTYNTDNNLDKTNTSILYVNDVHGKMTNMERICSVANVFDDSIDSKTNDKLKLASGDIILGANYTSNRVAANFLNWIGISANALGNHELDVVPSKLAELLNHANYKLLAINATVDEKVLWQDE